LAFLLVLLGALVSLALWRREGLADTHAVSPAVGEKRTLVAPETPALHPIFTTEVRDSAPAATTLVDDAVLNVLVFAEEARALAGIELRVVPEGGEPRTYVSDANGWAVALVRPGVRHTIETDAAPMRPGSGSVPALRPTERRWVPIGLKTEADFTFFARVVAAEDDTPLPAAVVEAVGTSAPGRVQVSADGSLRVTAARWLRPYLIVRAEGRPEYTVPVTSGFETAAEAQRVRLPRAAALRVFAVDVGTGPLADVPVRAFVRGADTVMGERRGLGRAARPDVVWEGRTDVWGLCELEGLHPGLPVHVEVRAPGRAAKAPPPIFLEPGALRQRDYVFGRGGGIGGHVVDQAGAPVPGLALLCKPGAASNKPWFQGSAGALSRCVTDGSGRFLFEDLGAGDWWVGPLPRELSEPAREDMVAPVAERVQLERDESRVELTLRVTRGLFIRGQVRAAAGVDVLEVQPVCGAVDGAARASTVPLVDGAFVLGPLAPGTYWVDAFVEGFVARRQTVEAGADGVTLELLVGGAVSGRVVDARTGEPAEASIFPYRTDLAGGWMEMRYGSEFDFQGLAPGAHTLVATTIDDRIGVLGVVVEAELELTGLELSVEAAAVLELEYVGAGDGVLVTVHQGAARVGGALAKPERIDQLRVPAGALTLVERDRQGRELARRDVVAVVGRATRVRLTER
jgi:hypothetical protein